MGMLIHHHRLKRLKKWQEVGNKKNLGTEHNSKFVPEVRKTMDGSDGPTPVKRRRGRPKKNAISNRTAIGC